MVKEETLLLINSSVHPTNIVYGYSNSNKKIYTFKYPKTEESVERKDSKLLLLDWELLFRFIM